MLREIFQNTLRNPFKLAGFRVERLQRRPVGEDAYAQRFVVARVTEFGAGQIVVVLRGEEVLLVQGFLELGVALVDAVDGGDVYKRQVRKVCPHCREEYRPDPEEFEAVGLPYDPGVRFYRGSGCPMCFGTGYRGRTGVFEVLVIDRALRSRITGGATREELKDAIERTGSFKTMEDLSLIHIYMVLTAFERAYDPAVGDARRFYFVHATLVSNTFIERAAKIPCVIAIQPVWLENFVNFGELRLGKERANRLFQIKDMMDAGLIVAGGTDAPVCTVNPFYGVECAVTRQAVGRDDVTLGADQAISVYQAVEMVTKNAAYWCSEEHRKGTLEVGKLADFIVLDRDIFAIDPKLIHETQVQLTVLNGEDVYKRQRLTTSTTGASVNSLTRSTD